MAEAGVRCFGVEKEFGDGGSRNRVLKGIDLALPSAEMSLLVGPSGCGKTTLISIIAALLDPTAGRVELFGEDLARLSDRARVEFRSRNIGFVFQQYNLLPSLSAVENACVPLLIQGLARPKALETAEALLVDLGLGARLHARPSQLSGGEQQRVALARALVHGPRLLVCDEPTAALDAESGRHVMSLLRAIALRPDRAVIVVTHDDRVLEFGDRLIHMADGVVERITAPDGGRHREVVRSHP